VPRALESSLHLWIAALVTDIFARYWLNFIWFKLYVQASFLAVEQISSDIPCRLGCSTFSIEFSVVDQDLLITHPLESAVCTSSVQHLTIF
jgi:hypothetical protein